ncbi:hypothetical protein [Kangiella koreensis]|uniref:Uncharacterized protein n=1 Tax=Kangiella koreensis (strain DSM 16069 / JCM 12317 / KCTC 12182 / SW-125) TaxID=523791 RepID=C7RB08_KANKD|nr:hypothetical protein [Kangiella koreensis]ACV26450.1 conserved hypothetical protein [Kangiella koreensis DSM 16069]
MAIKIIDCHIENCGTGISTDGSVQIDISGTKIIGCKKAIEHRDPPGALQSLGLPENTPPNLLVEALEVLLKTQEQGPEKSAEAVSKTRLFEWLGGISNATSILANLVALQQSGFVQKLLSMLPK